MGQKGVSGKHQEEPVQVATLPVACREVSMEAREMTGGHLGLQAQMGGYKCTRWAIGSDGPERNVDGSQGIFKRVLEYMTSLPFIGQWTGHLRILPPRARKGPDPHSDHVCHSGPSRKAHRDRAGCAPLPT